MKSSTNRALVAKKQSTFSAVMATNLLNVLQGCSKSIRLLLVMFLTLTVTTNAWGGTWTWTAASGNFGTSPGSETGTVTLNGKSWDYSRDIAGYLGWGNSSIQFGSKNAPENVTLSTSAFSSYTITSISVKASSYNGAHKLTIKVGDATVKSATTLPEPTSSPNAISTGTISKKGDIRLEFSDKSRALYIQSITVTYEDVTCTTPPTVSAGSNSNVTTTTVTVSCSNGITSLGSAGCSIESYGFVYGTSSNPTISNTKVQVGTTYTTTGTAFSKGLTGLTANTTYYVRPYATNGNGTAYGTQTSFTTLELPKYTVTWDVNGDQSVTTQVTEGSKPTFPATPSSCDATSTTFYGWATATWDGKIDDINGKTIYTSANDMPAVNGAVTYYAVFAEKSGFDGNVDFGTQGWAAGADLEDVGTAKFGDVISIAFLRGTNTDRGPQYIKDNNTGLFDVRIYPGNQMTITSTVAMSKINFTFSPDDENAITSSSGTISNTIWTGNTTSVTFTVGGTSGHRKIQSLEVITTGGTVSYSNYTTSCGQTYTITWKNYDGTTLKTEEVAYGTTPSYTGTTPTKVATEQYTYTHTGWTPNVVAVTDNATYTATFTETPRTYTITLNTNGGTINAGNVTSYTYGVGATLPTNVTKENHQFGGWFDNSGCTGTAVTAISTTATGNKEYWAKWTELPKYIVTWSADGTPIKTQEVYVNEQVSEVPTSSDIPEENRCGDKFFGWTTDPIATPQDDAPTVFTTVAGSPTITGDITFYAVFADYKQ